MPSLTYMPSHRPCPHPHTPHPTEQAPSDCRNRSPVTAHKGTHTTQPSWLPPRQPPWEQADAFSSHLIFSNTVLCWGEGASTEMPLSKGPSERGSLLYLRCCRLPLLSCNPYSWRPPRPGPCVSTCPGKGDPGSSNPPWALEPGSVLPAPSVCGVGSDPQLPGRRGRRAFETVGNGIEPPQVHEIGYHLGHNVLVLYKKESPKLSASASKRKTCFLPRSSGSLPSRGSAVPPAAPVPDVSPSLSEGTQAWARMFQNIGHRPILNGLG